jgi:RNA polymerase sigma-70 factor (ECF subfamily)
MTEPLVSRSRFGSEEALIAALRAGDEQAFAALVEAYGAAMCRFALTFVRTQAVADEVVQEAWLGMLQGLDRFEGRSSLKTWLFRIVSNMAKTRAVREARSVPFSTFDREADDDEAAVPADRFHGPGHVYAGGWVAFPQPWSDLPEAKLEAAETRAVIAQAIGSLPTAQRLVISLRDVEGLAADEVCNVLEVSETNQRVLLHRARSKVRAALESYLTEETL